MSGSHPPFTLRLRPGTPSDVPAMVAAYASGFAGNLVAQRVFSLPSLSPPARRFWTESLLEELKDPFARFLVVENTSTAPPAFIGFAKWVAPGAAFAPMPERESWPQDGDVELALAFFGALSERHEETMADTPHWYLELITVHKEFQGRGAGGILLRWGVQRADEDGVPCYLDSTPDGKGVYVRFGFREVSALDFAEGRYRQCFMVRDAKTAGSREGLPEP